MRPPFLVVLTVVAALAAALPALPAVAQEQKADAPPAPPSGMKLSGAVLTLSGASALVAGAVLLGLASQPTNGSPPSAGAPAGVALIGGGALLTGAGLPLWIAGAGDGGADRARPSGAKLAGMILTSCGASAVVAGAVTLGIVSRAHNDDAQNLGGAAGLSLIGGGLLLGAVGIPLWVLGGEDTGAAATARRPTLVIGARAAGLRLSF